MPTALVKLVAVLLMCVQGLVAAAPGQVLCIPVQSCGMHEHDGHAVCGRCHSGGSDDEGVVDQRREHELDHMSAAVHLFDECGCYLHVPVPDREQVPVCPRGDNTDLRQSVLPLLVASVLVWDIEPAPVVVARFKPPDLSVSDQVLGLKATRLLI
ncbi:MAG: hypothetical protein AB7K52_04425 [Phycisphaerales bacterium]